MISRHQHLNLIGLLRTSSLTDTIVIGQLLLFSRRVRRRVVKAMYKRLNTRGKIWKMIRDKKKKKIKKEAFLEYLIFFLILLIYYMCNWQLCIACTRVFRSLCYLIVFSFKQYKWFCRHCNTVNTCECKSSLISKYNWGNSCTHLIMYICMYLLS